MHERAFTVHAKRETNEHNETAKEFKKKSLTLTRRIHPINYIIVFKLNPQFNVNDVNAITQIYHTFAHFYLSFSHAHAREMHFPPDDCIKLRKQFFYQSNEHWGTIFLTLSLTNHLIDVGVCVFV